MGGGGDGSLSPSGGERVENCFELCLGIARSGCWKSPRDRVSGRRGLSERCNPSLGGE